MTYSLVRKSNRYVALAEMMLHMNKHNATRRLQLRQVVPLLNGSINRDQYYFISDATRIVGFGAWALADRDAARRWAFEEDGSGIGDGRTGEGAILNFLICDTRDVAQFARRQAHNVFGDLAFLCARRSYANGKTRPVWIDLSEQAVPATTQG